ncbi:hypothetical protein EDD22DRAFT_847896 [Suillus occidentalis]|nr:hypothetical protein EDD22DRAFT_847896 [Suillus occidentalis]
MSDVGIVLEFRFRGSEKKINIVERSDTCTMKIVKKIILEESEDNILIGKRALQKVVNSICESKVPKEIEEACCRMEKYNLLISEERTCPGRTLIVMFLHSLESAANDIQLVHKFVGDNSRATSLNDVEAFSIAMDHLCHKVSDAYTQVVALEVKNAAVKQTTTTKAKRGIHADDIPSTSSDKDVTQLTVYKQLESQIQYHISDYNNHHQLDNAKMTLWAKQIISLVSTREKN